MYFFKRILDIILSLLLLLIFFVPMLLVAGLSLCFQGSPALLRQRRYGRGGKAFEIYKFRTMKNGAPNVSTSTVDEHLITRWGALLRKTSIDELPQLFNVLKGDMSIVGPRPLIIEEDYAHKLRLENNIYSVRPGMTGYAQINGRDDVEIEQKIMLDRYYVEHASFSLDLEIVFKSFFQVVMQKGVSK